jgi:hypothetical protein
MKTTNSMMTRLFIIAGTILMIFITNQIFLFFNISLMYVIPYILWAIGLVLFYLILPRNTMKLFTR